MKLQVLVDNNTYIDHYYLGEPGVSYYVEIDDKKILFDAGYSDIMIRNAHSLGVDLKKITHIVLSHGHDDHSKGLKYLFSQFSLPNATLVAHPGCFAPGGSRAATSARPSPKKRLPNSACISLPGRLATYLKTAAF